jgi:hypothetical protein
MCGSGDRRGGRGAAAEGTGRAGLGSSLCWFRAGLVLVQIAMGAMTRPGECAVANDLAFTGVSLGAG